MHGQSAGGEARMTHRLSVTRAKMMGEGTGSPGANVAKLANCHDQF